MRNRFLRHPRNLIRCSVGLWPSLARGTVCVCSILPLHTARPILDTVSRLILMSADMSVRPRTYRRDSAPLLLPRTLVSKLMRLYDYPHPIIQGRTIRGYDRPHAVRTARMCAAVAVRLGHGPSRVRLYQIACLLHDLGRAGLDRRVFGKIWSWAKLHGIPTRPREWRAVHPETRYGHETEAFWKLYAPALKKTGISLDQWSREQVEMRLGYARRLSRRLKAVKPILKELAVPWEPWMESVMLYYYYPEKLMGAKPWVRQLAEVLVACEQFEAYNNRQRGADYYTRRRERMDEAVNYLEKLRIEGMVSEAVVKTLVSLAGEGAFDRILIEARGKALSKGEKRFLQSMTAGTATCR